MLPRPHLLWLLIGLLLGYLLCTAVAHAANVHLVWNFNTTENPTGTFAVYESRGCTDSAVIIWTQGLQTIPCPDAGDLCAEWTSPPLNPGATYCWYIVGRDEDGNESAPTNTVQFTVPRPQTRPTPHNLRKTRP